MRRQHIVSLHPTRKGFCIWKTYVVPHHDPHHAHLKVETGRVGFIHDDVSVFEGGELQTEKKDLATGVIPLTVVGFLPLKHTMLKNNTDYTCRYNDKKSDILVLYNRRKK